MFSIFPQSPRLLLVSHCLTLSRFLLNSCRLIGLLIRLLKLFQYYLNKLILAIGPLRLFYCLRTLLLILLQQTLKPILHRMFRPVLHTFRYGGPFLTNFQYILQKSTVFLLSPLSLFNVRVQVVTPPLPALLGLPEVLLLRYFV